LTGRSTIGHRGVHAGAAPFADAVAADRAGVFVHLVDEVDVAIARPLSLIRGGHARAKSVKTELSAPTGQSPLPPTG
jgi:hypothetical protein